MYPEDAFFAIPLHRNMGLFWENVALFRENTSLFQENLGLEGGEAFTLGSLKLQVSFAKEPYKRDYIL